MQKLVGRHRRGRRAERNIVFSRFPYVADPDNLVATKSMISLTLPTARRGSFIVISFALSVLITALFIKAYKGYVSNESMLLSGSIASGKWAIQIVAGLLLLGDKRWHYVRELAATCFIGSLTLLPYAILSGGPQFFFGSLGVSILTMCIVIYLRLSHIGLSWRWKALWFTLLACAVSLQLTVVFHII